MPAAKKPTGPTLTDMTFAGRMALKYGIVFLVVMMVGRVVVTSMINYWKATHPEPPPAPTVGFGKLPAIQFKKQTSKDKPKSYRLEIATRELPEFGIYGDRAKVFFMPKSAPSLLADERVKEIASSYNFVFEPEVIDNRTYRWTKSQPLESSIQIDVQTLGFSLKTDYLSRPNLLMKKNLPENFEAVNRIKAFLDAADLLGDDMSTASGKITFLKSLGGELKEAFSLSDADFVQVDLNRMTIDNEYGMITPEGTKGIVSAIITGAYSGNLSIVQMDYHYRPINYIQVETYPLQSTKLAWKLLQAGEGFIVNKGKKEEIIIRKIYMAYFDSYDEQEFLQPVYVFEGDDDYIGIVPALDSRYTQSK